MSGSGEKSDRKWTWKKRGRKKPIMKEFFSTRFDIFFYSISDIFSVRGKIDCVVWIFIWASSINTRRHLTNKIHFHQNTQIHSRHSNKLFLSLSASKLKTVCTATGRRYQIMFCVCRVELLQNPILYEKMIKKRERQKMLKIQFSFFMFCYHLQLLSLPMISIVSFIIVVRKTRLACRAE